MKIFLYIYHTLVCDIETQMKGLVILVWYDTKSKINANPDITRIKMLVKIHEASPVRLSAVHMCVPDTPVFRFRQSILTLAIGQNRSRLRIHLGMYYYTGLCCVVSYFVFVLYFVFRCCRCNKTNNIYAYSFVILFLLLSFCCGLRKYYIIQHHTIQYNTICMVVRRRNSRSQLYIKRLRNTIQ